jgi:hypothetical protein
MLRVMLSMHKVTLDKMVKCVTLPSPGHASPTTMTLLHYQKISSRNYQFGCEKLKHINSEKLGLSILQSFSTKHHYFAKTS